MAHRDDFDGGKLLALFGLEDDELRSPPTVAQPEAPTYLAPAAQPRLAAAPPPPAAPPPARPAPRRRPLDLRNLSADDLVRSFVLADILGPPPGKRGLRRRRNLPPA
jgi:hypothetical protein